jgi:flagellar protein FlgJ
MKRNRTQRLAEVAAIATRLEPETGVPARMLVAQWAIESRWGTKPTGNANYFGIKRAKRHAKYCAVATREVVDGQDEMQVCEFADYASLEESCRDYAWLITHGAPYRRAWQQYGRLALSIAGQANVDAAIQSAKVSRA